MCVHNLVSATLSSVSNVRDSNMIDGHVQGVFMYPGSWAASWFVCLCVIIVRGFGVRSTVLNDLSVQCWLLERTS